MEGFTIRPTGIRRIRDGVELTLYEGETPDGTPISVLVHSVTFFSDQPTPYGIEFDRGAGGWVADEEDE